MRLGLVLNILDEEYQIYLYTGIIKTAKELGIEIVCFQQENTHFSPDELISLFPKKEYFDLDGIILLTTVMIDNYEINKKENIEKIWGKDIPIISVGQKVEGIPSLMVEGESSMRELVEHLILKHKYRNFLYISGMKNHPDAISRGSVFVETISEYQKKIPDLKYTIERGSFSETYAIKAMSDYYASHKNENPDCVVCANDNMAIGVYKFFKMNRDNPEIHECAVTGFDDIPQAKYELPSLTTISQPLKELGEKAVYIMKDLIEKKEVPQDVIISSKVVYRKSCGCDSDLEENISNKEFMSRIQANYVQSESLLRLVTHIGQDMNYAESISGINYVINRNVEQLDLRNFCILRFSNNDKASSGKKDEVLVDPLYVRREGLECYEFYKELKLPLGQFYKRYMKIEENQHTSLAFKFLTTGKEVVGCVLYEANKNVLPYLSSITINIAQALTRIMAMEERKKRSEYLEREVNIRTKELVEANNKRMEVEAEVLKISELERQRFSNDLHDDICQRLAGISMLCRSYSNQEKPIEKNQMVELAELIGDTLQTTRQYAHNSYPVELESLGMNHSLSNLCNSFRTQTGIECIYNWELEKDIELDNLQKLNIFRIIQEALHNVLKHSKASSVTVSVKNEGKKLIVQIIDNGCGIPSKKSEGKAGIGLNSMEYRANQIGAKFLLKKNKPTGTCVQVTVGL
ncbi:MAG: substrate-binding domain-containing protein [Treponema sp.]|nr:substrate-binding domain-containing protein [Treponema sp.]